MKLDRNLFKPDYTVLKKDRKIISQAIGISALTTVTSYELAEMFPQFTGLFYGLAAATGILGVLGAVIHYRIIQIEKQVGLK